MKEYISIVPEGYYEMLSSFIPASYLILNWINYYRLHDEVNGLIELNSSNIQLGLLFSLVAYGVILLLGQLINIISECTIKKVMIKFHNQLFPENCEVYYDIRYSGNHLYSTNVLKLYSKVKLANNFLLINTVFIIMSILSQNGISLIFYSFATIVNYKVVHYLSRNYMDHKEAMIKRLIS